MAMSTEDKRRIDLARDALKLREDLAGAGRSIMASYGLDERTARRLHAEELARRKSTKENHNG